jgi:hypothetical protein
MNELLVSIMLIIPTTDKMVDWTMNEVPTEIQVLYESGVQVSYPSTSVPCTFKPRSSKELVFMSPQSSLEDNYCYAIFDISRPNFIRHPNFWYRVNVIK